MNRKKKNKEQLNTRKDIKIMVCFHKPYEMPADDIYLPIQVGKAISTYELNIQADDQGEDNISALNPIYCEMTAMYWAWKNIRDVLPNVKYIGLCHYRRYFYVNKNHIKLTLNSILIKMKLQAKIALNNKLSPHVVESAYPIENLSSKEFLISNSKLSKIVEASDIVTTRPVSFLNLDVRTFFSVIGREYISLMEEIVEDMYPSYSQALKRTLKGSKLHSANMIILKKDYIDEYCEFIFGVLKKHIEEVKKRGICICPEKEKNYSRVSGYLAEILTSTFIESMKGKVEISYTDKFFINL